MEHNDTYQECDWVCASTEVGYEDELSAAARSLRADRQVAPLAADLSNLLLIEAASRYARLQTLPAYLSPELRAVLEPRLSAMRAAGRLRSHTVSPDSCMLHVGFTRRYGRERAQCLRGHGARPGETPH